MRIAVYSFTPAGDFIPFRDLYFADNGKRKYIFRLAHRALNNKITAIFIGVCEMKLHVAAFTNESREVKHRFCIK